MKYTALIFSLFLSMSLFAQEKDCFESEREAKAYAMGTWKEKDVASDVYYRISFKGLEGKIVKFDESDVSNDRNQNKYDLVFNEPIVLKIEELNDCWQIGRELKAAYGTEFQPIKFLSRNEFVFMDRHFTRAGLVLGEVDLSCESGTNDAIKDAKAGKYKLLSYGLIAFNDWDFQKFYWDYVKEKHGITLGTGGCVVSPRSQCYTKKMEALIYEKFGEDVFEKAREEAKVAYEKSKND